jgi:hypothetical protein
MNNVRLLRNGLDKVEVVGSNPDGIIQLRRLNPLLNKGLSFFYFSARSIS